MGPSGRSAKMWHCAGRIAAGSKTKGIIQELFVNPHENKILDGKCVDPSTRECSEGGRTDESFMFYTGARLTRYICVEAGHDF